MPVFIWIFFFFLFPGLVFGIIPERRPDGISEEFGWFVAPTPIAIEGVGSSIFFSGILSNFYQTSDLFATRSIPGGEFDFGAVVIDEVPLYTKHLLLTAGKYDNSVTVTLFERGIDSKADDYILPFVHEKGDIFQAKLLFWEERLVFFYQLLNRDSTTERIYDKNGNILSSEPTNYQYKGSIFGAIFDFTDDPIDPRKGIRLGHKMRPVKAGFQFQSDIRVNDTNLTGYLPLFGADTLVFNFYTSLSSVIRQGITDEATARMINNQNCAMAPDYNACKAGEDKLVADFIAYNKYGFTSMGGSNRLRAYPMSRFSAGNASYQGIEYRYNFSATPTKINWYVLGGLETLLQIAFFYEQGTVAEDISELYINLKPSYGVGFRALISGFVYRFDFAYGDEGFVPTIFIDYPMDLNPIAGN
ncbi:MAG: hypothetical protein OEY59_11060 [Deltaproteobacteria bacterium]|nr:hypothetical protein [Deltaproteobacteria bacterium]